MATTSIATKTNGRNGAATKGAAGGLARKLGAKAPTKTHQRAWPPQGMDLPSLEHYGRELQRIVWRLATLRDYMELVEKNGGMVSGDARDDVMVARGVIVENASLLEEYLCDLGFMKLDERLFIYK